MSDDDDDDERECFDRKEEEHATKISFASAFGSFLSPPHSTTTELDCDVLAACYVLAERTTRPKVSIKRGERKAMA